MRSYLRRSFSIREAGIHISPVGSPMAVIFALRGLALFFQRNEFLHLPPSICCCMEICVLLSDALCLSRDLRLHIQQEQ